MKDVRTEGVERKRPQIVTIPKETIIQREEETIVLEKGDKIKVYTEGTRSDTTPNGWDYRPDDPGMSGYDTLYFNRGGIRGGNPDDFATITYIPEEKGFQFMPSEEDESFTNPGNAFQMLKEAKAAGLPLSAEDLIYFL